MRHKIPPAAFAFYYGLGPGRTYAAVAKEFGVSVRGVTKRALKEGWRDRLARIEADARRKQDERAVEDVAAVDDKHLRMARAIQARALETLKSSPLGNGTAAVRALDVAIRIERAILGRGKEAESQGYSHAATAALAATYSAEAVAAADAVRARELAEKQAVATPPAEPVVPPVLLPRIYSEN